MNEIQVLCKISFICLLPESKTISKVLNQIQCKSLKVSNKVNREIAFMGIKMAEVLYNWITVMRSLYMIMVNNVLQKSIFFPYIRCDQRITNPLLSALMKKSVKWCDCSVLEMSYKLHIVHKMSVIIKCLYVVMCNFIHS